jgi:hypothetical protein
MLEHLDEVPWHSIQDGDEVPIILRNLLSEDADDRYEAFADGLLSVLSQHGAIVSATGYAVPFLLELLCAKATPCRGRLAIALASYAASARLAAAKPWTPAEPYFGTVDHGNRILEEIARRRSSLTQLVEDKKESTPLRAMALATLMSISNQEAIRSHLNQSQETELIAMADVIANDPDGQAFYEQFEAAAMELQNDPLGEQ